ncbi:helix-turn-helix domain-containing protein [Pedobacter nutrimenti]|uniref:AraC-like DNA-binding protein n=1 Tax=Pedobacter nutrimenti TaxID=1241337 RepID=A0A318UIG7_9SPHI|nr:AraC family transcriptional regulator [Pedobacter nutrimenti]PYF76122.1 AraC-like DNA-binding protein [Pedobacter nutrimenti]
MKTPFKFELDTEIPLRILIRRKRNSVSKHTISYARVKLIRYKSIKILRQTFSGFAFYLELITHFVKKRTLLTVKVAQNSLVFVYALKDDLTIAVSEQPEPIVIVKGQCFVQTVPAGVYRWNADPGKMKFVYFVLRPTWLLKMRDVYPKLAAIVKEMQDVNAVNMVLPPYVMTRHTARQLDKLRNCKASTVVDLEENLLHVINMLIAEYHNHLLAPVVIPYKSPKQIIYEARDMIIEQVENGIIPSVTAISSQFNIEPKALRRHCNRIFNMNIQDLVEDAQMKKGHSLIHQGVNIKSVSERLGFAETAIFSRKYKRYFGYSPSKLQSADN